MEACLRGYDGKGIYDRAGIQWVPGRKGAKSAGQEPEAFAIFTDSSGMEPSTPMVM